MDRELAVWLINSAAVLLALGLLYDLLISPLRTGWTFWHRLLSGLVVGGIGVAVMLNCWEFREGVMFDARSIVLGISGLFLGVVPTLTAAAIMAAYRLYEGGVGTGAGLGIMVTASAVGLLWRRLRHGDLARISLLELWLMGLVIQAPVVPLVLAIPMDVSRRALAGLLVPMLLMYPLVTALLGKLMAERLRRRKLEASLRDNESRYRSYVDNAPYGVFVVDRSGHCLHANKAACRITGYTREELEGMQLTELLPEDEREKALQGLKEATHSGRVASEAPFVRRDGTQGYWSVNVARLSEDRYLGFVEDITERKRAQEALQETGRRLRLAAQAANVGFWDWDLCTNRVYYSREWKGQLGYAEDEIGDDYSEWESRLHPEDRERAIETVMRFKEDPWPDYSSEFRMLHKDGTYRNILTRASVFQEDGEPVRMMGCHVDITDLREAEEALRETRDRVQRYLDIAGVVILALDRDGTIELINKRGCKLLGYTEEELVGRNWVDTAIPADRRDEVRRIHTGLMNGAEEEHAWEENDVLTRDGERRTLVWHNTVLRDAEGRITGSLSSGEDVTERRQAEARLRQAQKMEAIGRLAGGVAHDFNNILTGMKGYLAFALSDLDEGTQTRADLTEMDKLADRAAALTRQLLAFSRRQALSKKVLNLNDLVEDVSRMLERLIGEHIDLDFIPCSTAGNVEADHHQMAQVLVNLAVNSRDAMPDGGRLTIETDNTTLDEATAGQIPEAEPGRYVTLAVTDTGVGMDEETRRQLFEPFFTTKDPAHGTGLGLATAHGIVSQHEGFITVYSEKGLGTTFRIYLPRVDTEVVLQEDEDPGDTRAHGESVLLVEDDPAVGSIARVGLQSQGYRVLTATSVESAVEVFQSDPTGVDLLLTDMMLPDGNGKSLFDRLSGEGHSLKVVYMSGYTDDTVVAHGVLDPGVAFVAKPFAVSELLRTVRGVLDR